MAYESENGLADMVTVVASIGGADLVFNVRRAYAYMKWKVGGRVVVSGPRCE